MVRRFGYFVEWDDAPGVSVFIPGARIPPVKETMKYWISTRTFTIQMDSITLLRFSGPIANRRVGWRVIHLVAPA